MSAPDTYRGWDIHPSPVDGWTASNSELWSDANEARIYGGAR